MAILGNNETLEAREAFEVWYQLPLSQRADFTNLSAVINIPVDKIKRWSTKHHWKQLARSRDEEVANRVAEHAMETAVATKITYHEKLRAKIYQWFKIREEDDELDIDTLKAMKPAELGALIKLDLEILGNKYVQGDAGEVSTFFTLLIHRRSGVA